MKKGPFKIIKSKIIYQNPWIKVYEDKIVRPDGKSGIFCVVEYSPGVSILALDEDKNVYLIKEYMYAIGRYDTMLPAGGVDKDETSLDAAKRELLGETGLTSDKWIELGESNPLTMVVKAPFYNFLALDVRKVTDGEKEIITLKRTLDEVIKMVEDGTISHSGTISTIFKAKLYLEKNK